MSDESFCCYWIYCFCGADYCCGHNKFAICYVNIFASLLKLAWYDWVVIQGIAWNKYLYTIKELMKSGRKIYLVPKEFFTRHFFSEVLNKIYTNHLIHRELYTMVSCYH